MTRNLIRSYFTGGQERGGDAVTSTVSLEDLLVVSPDLVAPWLLCYGILTDTIVAAAFHVPHGGPPLLLFHLWVIV